jgi:hypothetical protein
MSTPIYKNEEFWRGNMLLAEISTRHAVDDLKATIMGAMLIYLVSVVYSAPVAMALAGISFAGCLWTGMANHKSRLRMQKAMDADLGLDI